MFAKLNQIDDHIDAPFPTPCAGEVPPAQVQRKDLQRLPVEAQPYQVLLCESGCRLHRWFMLRVQNEYPTAKVEFKNYCPYGPAVDIIISFKK